MTHHVLGRREMTAWFNGPLPDELTDYMYVVELGFDELYDTVETMASNSGSIEECLAIIEELPSELKPSKVHVTRDIITVHSDLPSPMTVRSRPISESIHTDGCGDKLCYRCYGQEDWYDDYSDGYYTGLDYYDELD